MQQVLSVANGTCMPRNNFGVNAKDCLRCMQRTVFGVIQCRRMGIQEVGYLRRRIPLVFERASERITTPSIDRYR